MPDQTPPSPDPSQSQGPAQPPPDPVADFMNKLSGNPDAQTALAAFAKAIDQDDSGVEPLHF